MPTLVPDQLITDLRKTPKEIPFSYLYDVKGSELYERITELEEYYPFLAEENLLKQHAKEIVSHIPAGTVIVELGCGTARKTATILTALIQRDNECRFAGIDVSASFLEEARINLLAHVNGLKSEHVTLVQADYIEGMREVRRRFPEEKLCALWLGSSVGNLTNENAVKFLANLQDAAGTNMQLLLCTDLWKDSNVLYAAYHDKLGVTEQFIKNGVRNALRAVGYEAQVEEEENWIYEVDINTELRRVEMWVRFPKGLELIRDHIVIKPGERILMEVSRKFTIGDIQRLAADSRFVIQSPWRNKMYGIHMLLPVEEAFLSCWADSDAFFDKVPDWSVKPIDVRHPFCFYYGHLTAFSKLKLLPDEEASKLDIMYSRGIDPIVLDPSQCHGHPEVPSEWPSKEECIAYVKHARKLVMEATSSKKVGMYRLSLALEHERMHQETLAYMMAQQCRKTFMENSKLWSSTPNANREVSMSHYEPDTFIPAGKVLIGSELKGSMFLWDNEGPPTTVDVSSPFKVASMPVSIAAFRHFVVEMKGYERAELWSAEDLAYLNEIGQSAPATWSLVGGEYYVHGPFSTRHWSEVAEEPALVSLSEAQAFCNATKSRVMTEQEYELVLASPEGSTVKCMRSGGWEWTSTVFEPFPGFQPMADYPEYSVDFFDGKHYVLKGSSTATHSSLLRDSFRNYFQRQYPYVFAKFRCCCDATNPK